jgi:hypothetical protein
LAARLQSEDGAARILDWLQTQEPGIGGS